MEYQHDSQGQLGRWGLAAAVLALGASVVRLLVYPVVTSDYTYFVAKWFATLQSHVGLSAFAQPFSDYAPLYLYLLKLLTYIPVSSLYSEKTLSLLFDLAMGYAAYRIVGLAPQRYGRGVHIFAFALIYALPTVILNSSLWGQSDSLWAAAALGSLFAMLIEAPLLAGLMLGIAVSFKVQAVFLLPVFLGFVWRRRDWQALLLVPGVFVLSLVPAWLGGAPFGDLLLVYTHQAGEYAWLNVSSQSIFAFTDNVALTAHMQDVLFWLGLSAAAVCALAITFAVSRLVPGDRQGLIFLSMLCVAVIPYLLPRMHERYFYLADILSTVYAFYAPKRWYLPLLVVLASLMAYMPFLSRQVGFLAPFMVDLRVPSVLLGLALAAMLGQALTARFSKNA